MTRQAKASECGLLQLLNDGLVTRELPRRVGWVRCSLCGREISSYGWPQHFKAHERRGEVTSELVQIESGAKRDWWSRI